MKYVALVLASLIIGLNTGCAASKQASEIPWPGSPVATSLSEAPIGEPQEADDVEGIDNCYFDGGLCIASQPSEAAIRGAAESGATVIINLRTDREMEGVDFDEAALCEELGIDYVHIPLGGPERVYTQEAVEQFASALERNRGRAVVHCASGGRATYLWVAYLVDHRGYDFNEAVELGEQLRFRPSPFEGLLGREVIYSLGEPIAEGESE